MKWTPENRFPRPEFDADIHLTVPNLTLIPDMPEPLCVPQRRENPYNTNDLRSFSDSVKNGTVEPPDGVKNRTPIETILSSASFGSAPLPASHARPHPAL